MTGMLQLNPTLSVQTPLGDGEAFLVIDYGPDVNTCYVVRLEGGIIKHVWSDDCRLYGNPMNGKGWDVGDEPGAGASSPEAPRRKTVAESAPHRGKVFVHGDGWRDPLPEDALR